MADEMKLKVGITIDKASANNKLKTELDAIGKNNKLKLEADFSSFLKENSKIKQTSNTVKELEKNIKNINDKTDLRKARSEFSLFRAEMKNANLVGRTFGEETLKNLGKVANWAILAGGTAAFLRNLTEMVTKVIDLDHAMINLRKTSEATEIQYAQFLDRSAQSAKDLGVAISDLVESSADFSRLGFDLTASEELSKVATLYKNVGDMPIEEATSNIISITKAYGIVADESLTIVDKLNEVGNNFAISSAGLGQALRVGGAALSAANNSLDESIALITAGNNALQDPDTVGQALKSVSMRIRNTRGELEELGEEAEGAAESITKLQTQILNRTGGKVNIMLDENTFKNTYQVLNELSKVWNELTDKNRADVLELIAGKHRATAVASILTNMADGEAALATSTNSAGSAMREQEQYMKGIEYSLGKLSATFQDFSRNTIDSGFIKSTVDASTAVLDVTNKIGFWNIALVSLVGTLATTSKLPIAGWLTGISIAAGRSAIAMGASAGAAGLMATALSPIGLIAIAAGVIGLVKVIDHFTTSLEEQREKVTSLTTDLQSLNTEYETLSAKDDLTAGESKRLELLEAEIRANEIILKQEQQKLYNQEKFANAPTTNDMSWTSQYSGALRDTIDEYNSLNEAEATSLEQQDKTTARKAELILQFKEEIQTLQGYKDAGVELLASDEQRLVQLNEKIAAYNAESAAVESTVQAMTTLEDITTEMNAAVSTYATALGELQGIQEKVKDGQSLSYDEMTKLKEQYPQLESAIYRTVDGWSVESGALSTLQEDLRQTALIQAQTAKDRIDAALKESLAIHRIVLSQITSYKQLWAVLRGMDVEGANARSGGYGQAPNMEAQKIAQQYLNAQKAEEELLKIQDEIASIGSGGIGGSSGSKKKEDPFEKLDKQFKERLQLSKDYIEDKNYYDNWGADNEVAAWKRVLTFTQDYYAKGKMSAELYAATIREVNKSIYAAQQAVEEAQLESIKTVADAETQIVELYEKQFDKKKEKLEDWHDEEKEQAEEAYNERKQEYQDDLDEFTKSIQAKKDALNDAYDEDTFNSDLADKQKELAEIQMQINELSLSASSGDRVANSQKVDLMKELADKQKEIDDFVNERSKTLQEEALDDSLSKYEDFIDNKQSALDADYDAEVAQIDRLYKKKLDKLQENYSKEELYSKAREALLTGEYGEITSLYDEMQKTQGEGWSALGATLEGEYLAKLREAGMLLAELDGAGINTGRLIDAIEDGNSVNVNPDGNAPSGTKIGDIVKVNNGKNAWKVVGYGDTRSTTGGNYNPATDLTSIQLYDTGGILKSGSAAMNLSGADETIFNAGQSKKLYDLIAGNNTADIASMMFKNIFSGLSGSALGGIVNKSTPIQIGSLVTIEGSVSDGNLARVQKTIDNGLAEFAKKINSGNITLNKGSVL